MNNPMTIEEINGQKAEIDTRSPVGQMATQQYPIGWLLEHIAKGQWEVAAQLATLNSALSHLFANGKE